MSRSLASLVLGLPLACGAPQAPGGSGTESSGASTDAATDTADATPTTAAPTTGGAAAPLTWEVIRYPEQPMVVDVVFTRDGPAPSLSHPDDPGARIALLAAAGASTTYRVRGLAPDTPHTLVYQADELHGEIELITYPPRPGFIPAFPVEGGPVDAAVPYRMFDLIPFPAFDTAGAFVVDAEGTTRWHLGGPSGGTPGPEGIWTALRLRPDGALMFLHENTVWIRDELGRVLLELSDDALGVTGLHHELIELPSGNFMALSMSFRDVDYGPDGVLSTAGDRIVEFTPAGEVVWTWDAFDHLDPQRVTEPFATATVNHPLTGAPAYDWTHGNAIVHDPERDTLLLSLRHQDWIVAIDHSSGDVLWRLGPGGDFEFAGPAFHHQHAPEWQPDGTLLLYDNGVGDPDLPPGSIESRAVRFELDEVAMTAKRVWVDDGEPIFVPFAGNADRLPGGRVLVTDSSITDMTGISARLRELDPVAAPMLTWSLRTPAQTFAYRGTAHDRLVGEPAP